MKKIPLHKAFQFIEPGPVALFTTANKDRFNVMTMSWHMAMEFSPPLIGCIIGPWDYSYAAFKKSKECVIAIPTVDLIEEVVDIGNCTGRYVEKFEKFNLTPVKGKKVGAPLIKECLVNLECRLVNSTLANKYGFHVLEVVAAWGDPKRKERRTFHANGDGTFVVDGKVINLRKKMLKLPQGV